MDYELLARVKPCSHVSGYIIKNCATNEVRGLKRESVARFFTKNKLINGVIMPSRGLLCRKIGYAPCEKIFCIKEYQRKTDEKYRLWR